MENRRGVRFAIDYLNSFFPVVLFKDELHKRAGCTCSYDDLARKLRRAAVLGQVKAVPYENEKGTKITKYQGNPGWINPRVYGIPMVFKEKLFIPLENKLPEPAPAPAVFFFETLQAPGVYSPYYTSEQAMIEDAVTKGIEAVYFTGTHENPVRL